MSQEFNISSSIFYLQNKTQEKEDSDDESKVEAAEDQEEDGEDDVDEKIAGLQVIMCENTSL